jgi:cyclophilin family peptidyl-prolyl cis-trans isomerase
MEDGFQPRRAGTGGSDLPNLPAEFSSEPYVRGTVGMARAQDPNSANSQFFIMFADGDFLNGQYTVVGQVVSGMEYVDNIKKGTQANNGAVTDPDRMIKVVIAADKQ